MAVPVSELQKINPSSIIEMFKLELNTDMHGTSDVYRFHAGTNLTTNGDIIWAGNTYQRFPVEADGFEYTGNGQLPRPKLRISNLLGTITALLLTLPEGLEGAKVTRIRTLARYLDAINFPGNTNPYGTPDPTAEFPQEIYYVDRKTLETRDVIEFELAAAFDLAGVRAPKRQCIANICQWQYKSAECGYTPLSSKTGTFSRKQLSATYSQSGTTLTVTSTSHGISSGDRVYLTPVSTAVTGTWAAPAGSTVITITRSSHNLLAGDLVTLTFTSGANAPDNGNYAITSVTTNTFTIDTVGRALLARSGNVTIQLVRQDGGYYNVASAATNTFTVTVPGSRTDSGSVTVNWLKVSITSHGLVADENTYILFSGDGQPSGLYQPATVSTNAFTLAVDSGTTLTGNATMTQWFSASDTPVYDSGSDVCGKRVISCQVRFGSNSELPFGSFPGVGTLFT